MDCSTPGFPFLHCLPEFAQTHVRWVGDAIQPSRPLSTLLLLPSIFPGIRLFSSESALCIRCPKDWSFSISRLHCCRSVTMSCLTLWDPMDCSTPGLPVHHQLLELTQTHVRWVGDAIQPSHPLSSPSPLLHLQSFPASWSFPMSQFSVSGGQNIGVSALASVLPMNIQDWCPLGWTGWISLQSKGLSRVFSNTTVQKHQFFGAQLSSQSKSYIHTWLPEKHSFD